MKKIIAISLLSGFLMSSSIIGQTTYNDVSQLFYTNCTYCHHDGGIAPFSLMNYNETASFSNSIYSSVNSSKMPPWQPDSTYTTSGRTVPHYLNENTLTEVERNEILQWITDGALEGDPGLALTPPKYGDVTNKLNGNADLVLQIPPFRSNSSGTNLNPYNCFVIPTNLTEDRWLRAWEVVPGNLEAVHHAVVTVDTTGTEVTDTSGNCANQGGQFQIGGWTPGSPPVVLPSKAPLKTGIRIPAGSSFILQMHYAPGSDGKVDSTKIRLFFYPKEETGIREMYSATLLQNWGFGGFLGDEIPVNFQGSFKATSATSQALKPHPQQPTTAFSIFAINPHSHSVCTKIKDYAFKGTDTIPIIRIPNWDFNWEGDYFMPTPIVIPAGYTLEADHYFNNSTSNTNLTGPPISTKWGPGTEDEMLFDSFLYFDYQAGDENIDLKAIVENDTLLTVGIDEQALPSVEATVYPNPTSDKIAVYFKKASDYQLTVYTLAGQLITEQHAFGHKLSIDVNAFPPGLYLLEIMDTDTNAKVCKKLVVENH